MGLGAFDAMGALSTHNEDPAGASRPFDKDRDGFVMSDGAAIMVIEEYEHAKARGARHPRRGRRARHDRRTYHLVAPPPDGSGISRCMRLAIEDADLSTDDVDYINAHGTSTPLNDVAETRAIKAVFGEHANELAISSTKSMLGHSLGATGAVEAGLTAMALHNEVIPPTIKLNTPDPECDLDYVPHTARKAPIKVALSNSLAFGGSNATLVLTRPN